MGLGNIDFSNPIFYKSLLSLEAASSPTNSPLWFSITIKKKSSYERVLGHTLKGGGAEPKVRNISFLRDFRGAEPRQVLGEPHLECKEAGLLF